MAVPVIEGADAWRAEGDDDRGHVGVVVVHGFTGNPVSTRPLGQRLHADGFTVEVIRLPGHGTTAREMSGTRYADWLAAVEQAHDDLAQRCEQVALVGLSMGGTLCLDVAARRDVAAVATINAQVLNIEGPLARLAPILQHLVPMVPAKLAGVTPDDIKAGGTEKAYDQVPAPPPGCGRSCRTSPPRCWCAGRPRTTPCRRSTPGGSSRCCPVRSASWSCPTATTSRPSTSTRTSCSVPSATSSGT